jgi:hypothetical protein
MSGDPHGRTVWKIVTAISDELTASIVRVHPYTLKMEPIRSSETSITHYHVIQRHISSDDSTGGLCYTRRMRF